MILYLFIYFIYLGFYVAFNTVQVISRRVVGRAEETSTYSSLGFCTVNCRLTASNYQLSHLRPSRGSNPGLRGGRREYYHSATVAPVIMIYILLRNNWHLTSPRIEHQVCPDNPRHSVQMTFYELYSHIPGLVMYVLIFSKSGVTLVDINSPLIYMGMRLVLIVLNTFLHSIWCCPANKKKQDLPHAICQLSVSTGFFSASLSCWEKRGDSQWRDSLIGTAICVLNRWRFWCQEMIHTSLACGSRLWGAGV